MKGHWPKGVRRNADRGDWGVVRLALTSLLDNHAERGIISIRALASAVGVDPKAVCKWLDGTNRPDEEMQELVATWVRNHRDRLKRIAK